MSPRLAAIAGIAPLLAIRAPAHADEVPAIGWEAPAECPAADHVRTRVVENLGRPLRDGEVDARLVVAKAAAGWRVDMTVRTAAGEGERSLEAASCQELAESAALIVALTVGDAEAAEATTEELRREVAQLGDDEEPPRVEVDRRYENVRIATPYQPVDVDARFRVLVGGDLGTLPAAAPGIGGAVEIAFGPWSADVGVQRFAERDALLPDDPELPDEMAKGAHVQLTSVVARACYSDGRGGWRAGACLGGDLLLTRADGFGFTGDSNDRDFPERTDLSGGPQAGGLWSMRILGPVAVRADVTATFQAIRQILVYSDGTNELVIHDPELLVWRGFVGVEATWE